MQRQGSSDPAAGPFRAAGDGDAGVPLDRLSAAVAAETGVPAGRVRKILLSAERLRLQLQQAGPESPDSNAGASGQETTRSAPAESTASAPGGSTTLAADDPLRWYPIGANGRLRPPQHQELQP